MHVCVVAYVYLCTYVCVYVYFFFVCPNDRIRWSFYIMYAFMRVCVCVCMRLSFFFYVVLTTAYNGHLI